MGVTPVGTWGQPNFEDQILGAGQRGTVYKTNIDNSIAVATRLARNFAPHAKPTPDMNVLIDPGAVLNEQIFTEKTQQTAGPFTAPVSNPRIDRVVFDNLTGIVSILAGTEAGSPVVPLIPDEKSPICQVALTVGMTAITNALITDERSFGSPSSVIVKSRTTADVTIVSSAAELDLMVPYPVPPGLIGTNKKLGAYLIIKELDVPPGDNTIIRVKYGATTLGTFTIQGGGSGFINGVGEVDVKLFADGATNAQIAFMTVSATDGAGVVVFFEKRLGTSSIDSTVSQDLKITAQHSSSSVNNKIVNGHSQIMKE